MRGTVVTDTFTRTVSSGWGTADTGQVWSTIGAGGTVNATDWSVGSGVGVHGVPTTIAYRASYLAAFSQSFVDIAVTGSVAVTATGAPLELANLMARGTSITSYYLFRAQIETSQAVTALIFAPGGAQLGSITVPGITYTAGLQLRVRAQAVGKVLRLKVWKASLAEPAAWVLTVIDSTYTGAGWIGIRSGIAGGNTNAKPVAFSYDNFSSTLLPDFPRDPLPLTVLAAFGADLSKDPSTWPWTNITNDVRAGTVTITPGRGDETSQASPAGSSFQLLNDSKAYSAYNPAGPNYPYVRRNTPIWVIVDPATTFFGYANGFVPSWDTTGKQAIVSVSASGVLRRLTQGKTPLRSPLYRALSLSNPVVYWTLEDGIDSTQAASGITGGTPMTVNTGVMDFIDAGPVGSAGAAKPAVDTSNNMSAAIVGGSSSAWQVSLWTRGVITPLDTAFYIPAEIRTDNGQIYRLIVQTANPNTGFAVYPDETASSASFSVGENNANRTWIDGAWHLMQATVAQVGADAVVSYYFDGQLSQTATWAGVTIGRPVSVTSIGRFGGPTGQISLNMHEANIAHIAVHNTATLVDQYQAGLGFAGETATARLTRLCAEQGVPLAITGTSTTAVGPQSVDTFVNLLRECEAADLGLLYDGFGPGLGYITRTARYNQPTALTLDVAAGQVDAPFAPADDDQRNRNLWKVSRKNGSSATAEDKTGPLGTNPLTGIGTYDSSVTLNVATDTVLFDYASWLVHMGTVEGFRYPSLNLDLAASPELIDDWVAARLNARVDVLNVDNKATGHAPGTVSLLDEGYTETLTPFGWKVAANCSRYSPWWVFVLGTDRLQGSGSTVPAGAAAGATSLSVVIAAGNPLWITTATQPSMFPFDANIGGWQVTVTAITGVASPQTFTVNPTPGVIPANATVTLWQPRVLAL